MTLLQAVPPTPPPLPVDPNLVLSQIDARAIAFIVLFVMAAITIVCWPIARALARRLEGKGAVGPGVQAELEQMQHRLAELDALQQRVAELEDRLDFAERLLARGDNQATLPRGSA